MITELSPALKQHIELYIEDIENNRLTTSIFHCPVSILQDYINILRSVDVSLLLELETYVSIATYLGFRIKNIEVFDVTFMLSDTCIYKFRFPVQPLDLNSLNTELSMLLVDKFISTTLESDITNYCTTLTIRVG